MLIRTKVFGSCCFSLFVVLVFFVLSAHRVKIHILKPRTNRSREPFAGPGFHTALLLKSLSIGVDKLVGKYPLSP